MGDQFTLYNADCLEILKTFQDNWIDALITDPPYGWRFMGKAWDAFDIKQKTTEVGKGPHNEGDIWFIASDGKRRRKRSGLDMPSGSSGSYNFSIEGNIEFQKWTTLWAKEVFRVLKPGAHALIFCGPRTYHRMASGVEDAGFEIRDQLQWIFGSGFPKSLNIGKTLKDWEGWGTGLKPANEPILLARKPISEKTIAANVLKWGCGGINIDVSRIGNDSISTHGGGDKYSGLKGNGNDGIGEYRIYSGRFPSNLIFSHNEDCVEIGPPSHGQYAWHCSEGCAVRLLDEQSGFSKSSDAIRNNKLPGNSKTHGHMIGIPRPGAANDSGGASRFFYCAKPSKREKNEGCERLPDKIHAQSNAAQAAAKPGELYTGSNIGGINTVQTVKNNHPTVKSTRLMSYLINMITAPNGIILDPFLGSGTTGVAALQNGFRFIGIEKEREYYKIAEARLKHAKENSCLQD